jgi:hypothetical protein
MTRRRNQRPAPSDTLPDEFLSFEGLGLPRRFTRLYAGSEPLYQWQRTGYACDERSGAIRCGLVPPHADGLVSHPGLVRQGLRPARITQAEVPSHSVPVIRDQIIERLFDQLSLVGRWRRIRKDTDESIG